MMHMRKPGYKAIVLIASVFRCRRQVSTRILARRLGWAIVTGTIPSLA